MTIGVIFSIAFGFVILLMPFFLNKKHTPASIGSIQVSMGIFGTFLGVLFGLLGFDTANIQESVPQLLSGLKVAFITSVAGLGGFLWLKLRPGSFGLSKDEVKEEMDQDAQVRQMVSSLQAIERSLTGRGEGSLMSLLAQNNQQAIRASMQELFENFATNTQAVLGDALGRFNEGVGQMMAWQEAYAGRQEALLAAQEQVHQSMLDAEQAFTAFQHRAEQIAGIVDRLDGAIGRLDQATEGINESLGAIQATIEHFNIAMDQLRNNLAGLPQGVQEAVGEAIGNLNNSIQGFNTALNTFEDGLENALSHSLASLGNRLVSLSEKFAEDYTPLTKRLRDVLSIAEGIERPENVLPEIEEAQ